MIRANTHRDNRSNPPGQRIDDITAALADWRSTYARLRQAGTLTPEIARPLLRLRDSLHRLGGIDVSQPREARG